MEMFLHIVVSICQLETIQKLDCYFQEMETGMASN